MCNITINPKATAATIEKAFAKAEAQAGNYELRFHTENFYGITQTKTGAKYIVEVDHIFDECITCDCPEYSKSFFCKHCALVIEDQQIREYEEIEQAKIDWRGSETDKYAFA